MSLSNGSVQILKTCTTFWQEFVPVLAEYYNLIVTCGFRGQKEQDEAFKAGRSQRPWPEGPHNQSPSPAIDMVPVPPGGKIDWEDREYFTLFAGFVLGMAAARGKKVRWGGDWDQDREVKDNKFDDLVHFEEVM